MKYAGTQLGKSLRGGISPKIGDSAESDGLEKRRHRGKFFWVIFLYAFIHYYNKNLFFPKICGGGAKWYKNNEGGAVVRMPPPQLRPWKYDI